MRAESGQSCSKVSATGEPGRIVPMLMEQPHKSPLRVRSSSFPRRSASSCVKHASPLPTRRCAANDALMSARRSRFDSDLPIVKHHLDGKTESWSNEKDAADEESSQSTEVGSCDRESDDTGNWSRATDSQSEPSGGTGESNERKETTCWADRSAENAETRTESPMRAMIIKEPSDVTIFKGNRAVLQVTYQGRPEPTVKWLRVVRWIFLFVILLRLLDFGPMKEETSASTCDNRTPNSSSI